MPGGGSGVITPDVAFGFRDGKAKAGEKPAAEVPPKAGGEWLFRAAGRRRAAEPATRESQPGPGGMGAAAHEVASLTGRAAKPRSPQATRAGADDGADLSRQSPEAAEEAFGRQVAKGAEPDEMKRDFRRAVAERTAPVVAELSQKLAEAESAPARPAAPAAGPVAGQSGEQAAPAKAPAVVRAEPATAPAARADVTEAKPAEAATTRFGAVALGDNLQAGAEVTRFDVAGEGKQQAESLTAEIAPAAPAPAAATPPVPADKKAEPVVVAVVDTGVEGTHVNFSLGVANGVAQQVDTRKLDLGLQVPPTAAPEPAAKSAPGDVTVDYAAATAPDRDGDPLATDEKEVAAIDHARSEEALGDRSAIGQSLGKKLADTAKAIADLPVQGRLFGRKEAARTDAEDTADKTELGESLDLYYAAGQKAWDTDSDQVALGVDFRLTYPAAAKALEEERGKAGLEPEGAVRLLVERAEDLAPAEQERLAETLRQSQLASLAEERPLSEEELTAPPPPPPGPVNPFVMTERDRFSTFALEADTASYALARRYLVNGRRPAPGLIRMEEFVNAFDYAYPAQSTRTFAIHAEAGPAPFGRDLTLLKVGVKAKVLGRDGRKPAHLVFVLDTSGSMGREDRLPLVRFALGLMVTQLDPRDRLSLVTFDSQARLILEAVPAARATDIQAAVAALATSATTNLLAGVELGYQIAARHFRSGETNRVLLCTDGVANVGPADAEAVLAKVGQYRRQGITLTSVGVGSGSYDDRMLEQLANRGDGNYVFVDSPEQARRVFVDDFAGTLQMVARNAKIQVEFSPARVRRYRLIGYENRDVADKDFRNDAVDAGEIGSGQAATALYELELLPLAEVATLPADMGTVYVRYENVDTGRVEEISTRLSDVLLRERSPERDPRFLLAACAAEFAEVLRESEHARDGSLETLESLATRVANALPLDQRSQELLTLVRRAQGLPR
jgi:Ca-activated chloride channel family protein